MGFHTMVKLVNQIGYEVSVSQAYGKWTVYIHDPQKEMDIKGSTREAQKTVAAALTEAIVDMIRRLQA